MTEVVFRVPPLFDYVATVAWAISGAVVGIRKQFDVTGVFVVALLSSMGGGLMRDAIFLKRTPVVLTDPVYLPLVAGTTLIMVLLTERLIQAGPAETVRKLVDVIDSLGTPAFAVVGMQLARDQGIPVIGVIFVGAVNGLAGGLLRDVVVRDVPTLLRPGQFISFMLVVACGVFQILTLRYDVRPTPAAWVTVAAFFVMRVLALRFNWQTRSVWDPDTGRR
ncbi:MAG TPA: TRIC cation channel family protein [Vicinamibacterales bacterium]|nr:TRIC cation channel family protein [Vicinamibacterales bacterium]